jgi:hypothetical protein
VDRSATLELRKETVGTETVLRNEQRECFTKRRGIGVGFAALDTLEAGNLCFLHDEDKLRLLRYTKKEKTCLQGPEEIANFSLK